MSAPPASFIASIVLVAGHAIATSTTSGTTVQMISIVVFSWNCAALAPWERRCLKIDQNITPNTRKKITTHTHRMPQWRL